MTGGGVGLSGAEEAGRGRRANFFLRRGGRVGGLGRVRRGGRVGDLALLAAVDGEASGHQAGATGKIRERKISEQWAEEIFLSAIFLSIDRCESGRGGGEFVVGVGATWRLHRLLPVFDEVAGWALFLRPHFYAVRLDEN